MLTQRTNVILYMTAGLLLPLCSLGSLAALAPFSLLGLSGTLYTAVFMAIRFFDKSYGLGGHFLQSVPATLSPSFGLMGRITLSSKLFVLISMLSTAFVAHYSTPSFYAELKDTSMKR